MAVKSIWLGLNFEDAALATGKDGSSAEHYALELCAREQAHLLACLTSPLFKVPAIIPGTSFIPFSSAPADEVNATRRAHAEKAQARLACAAAKLGVSAEFHILQEPFPHLRDTLVALAMPSDFVILARPGSFLGFERHVAEALLFTSGRPVILVPEGWARGARFQRIVVAWDGSGRAARAVGDALPLLIRAEEEVEIVSVSSQSAKSIPSAGLAAHLARHCTKATAASIPFEHGSIAGALRAYAKKAQADLLVMGGYAHPRMLELVLGGVTSDMLIEAELPVLLSH